MSRPATPPTSPAGPGAPGNTLRPPPPPNTGTAASPSPAWATAGYGGGHWSGGPWDRTTATHPAPLRRAGTGADRGPVRADEALTPPPPPALLFSCFALQK